MTTFMPAAACLLAALCAVASHGAPAFKPAADGGFEFDTGVLRGRLRAGGKSLGLSSVVHVPTATRLDSSNGLFSHYRVFTRGKRHGGGAWDWPSTATLRPDGAVEVLFPATPERPIELKALYRWAGPATLDLETTVRAVSDLEAFESFLASYFSAPFTNSIVYARDSTSTPNRSGFFAADKPAGDWQIFPRDDAAAGVIRDGRWQLEPHPVAWVIRPPLARPLAVRRAPGAGLAAILMAAPTDCFAIATPHESDGHYSTYLSLFGRDLKAGETARARARLVILPSPSASDAEIIRLCETWEESR
ncbi:MAG TPA: hypothetical protein PKM43_09360 [Verrucomicrobiota bacterium]|nr:hypothetical protein [Verrucomicrobiota bacterium]HRZ36846.1 hypothetical protein [Candidatus Paceibacterota bacterium]HRZ56384.1 hypothetical protein [Candidatus Paceibacterota bacterium]